MRFHVSPSSLFIFACYLLASAIVFLGHILDMIDLDAPDVLLIAGQMWILTYVMWIHDDGRA